jgi:hypothetical protein
MEVFIMETLLSIVLVFLIAALVGIRAARNAHHTRQVERRRERDAWYPRRPFARPGNRYPNPFGTGGAS